ncbi:hypothetical protein ACOSP7_031233 [Xanthoceras sorbifolium]
MSRSSDQEHHKADTGGSPDVGDRRPCPFNEVVAMDRGGKTATTRRSEVIGSFTSSRVEARRDQGEPAEISTLGDQDENEGVVLGAGEVDDPSLAVPDFLFLSSIIKIEDLMVQSGVLRLVRRRRRYSALLVGFGLAPNPNAVHELDVEQDIQEIIDTPSTVPED